MPPRFGDSREIAATRALERGAGHMAGVALVALCQSPAITRAWVDGGRPGPCYRCLAYRPGTPTGCHFTESGATPAPVTTPPGDPGLFD